MSTVEGTDTSNPPSNTTDLMSEAQEAVAIPQVSFEMSNEKLAHELALDPNYCLKPCELV